jgi:hypothetical protein
MININKSHETRLFSSTKEFVFRRNRVHKAVNTVIAALSREDPYVIRDAGRMNRATPVATTAIELVKSNTALEDYQRDKEQLNAAAEQALSQFAIRQQAQANRPSALEVQPALLPVNQTTNEEFLRNSQQDVAAAYNWVPGQFDAYTKPQLSLQPVDSVPSTLSFEQQELIASQQQRVAHAHDLTPDQFEAMYSPDSSNAQEIPLLSGEGTLPLSPADQERHELVTYAREGVAMAEQWLSEQSIQPVLESQA